MPKDMLDRLRTEICEVTFLKADGSERTMICTLKEDFLPYVSVVQPTPDSYKNDYIPVFDLEEKSWRAFKPSRVIRFESSPE